jgi:hypothetical protein
LGLPWGQPEKEAAALEDLLTTQTASIEFRACKAAQAAEISRKNTSRLGKDDFSFRLRPVCVLSASCLRPVCVTGAKPFRLDRCVHMNRTIFVLGYPSIVSGRLLDRLC